MSEQSPQFSPSSLAEWEAEIVRSLKGRHPESLHWKPEPGMDLAAYYTKDNLEVPKAWQDTRVGQFPFLRGTGMQTAGDGWQLVQDILLDQPQLATQIQAAQTSGVSAYRLHGDSLSIALSDQLDLSQIALHLAIDAAPILSTTDLKMMLSLQGVKQQHLTGTLENDPISVAAAQGKVLGDADWVACEGGLTNMNKSPHFRSLGLNLSYVKTQGGAIVHELAFALGTIVEYLDQFSRMGQDVPDLLVNISVTFGLGNRFFLELAKFRAFRVLYAHMVSAYGIEEKSLQSPFVMAETTGQESALDLPNHLIQATTQVISAVMGGANAVIAAQDEHAHTARLSRNIQHLLRHESQLHQVQDPAGGAYYIEAITHQLAQEAWELFQVMEGSGGFLANIRNGRVPSLIEAYRMLEEERKN